MRYFLPSLVLILVVATQNIPSQAALHHFGVFQQQGTNLGGRWQVKFNFSGVGEKNLVFDAKVKGAGSFLLLDTAPDGKPTVEPQPAAWSQTTHDRVNFSGEVELPIGTCCREIGTLMLKGKFNSSKTISGKVLFVTSTVDEESIIGFRSMLGTFTATRVPERN